MALHIAFGSYKSGKTTFARAVTMATALRHPTLMITPESFPDDQDLYQWSDAKTIDDAQEAIADDRGVKCIIVDDALSLGTVNELIPWLRDLMHRYEVLVTIQAEEVDRLGQLREYANTVTKITTSMNAPAWTMYETVQTRHGRNHRGMLLHGLIEPSYS